MGILIAVLIGLAAAVIRSRLPEYLFTQNA
jgi:hypothetical protein